MAARLLQPSQALKPILPVILLTTSPRPISSSTGAVIRIRGFDCFGILILSPCRSKGSPPQKKAPQKVVFCHLWSSNPKEARRASLIVIRNDKKTHHPRSLSSYGGKEREARRCVIPISAAGEATGQVTPIVCTKIKRTQGASVFFATCFKVLFIAIVGTIILRGDTFSRCLSRPCATHNGLTLCW